MFLVILLLYSTRVSTIILIYNFKAPYSYGYDVNEYDEYGNPKVFSKHEEKDGYGNLKGKTDGKTKYQLVKNSNRLKPSTEQLLM